MRVALLLCVLLQACADSPGGRQKDPAERAAANAARLADDNVACAQIILVQHHGDDGSSSDLKREPAEAAARAQELQVRLERGEDFAALARTESDAPFGTNGDGVLGTFRKRQWPQEIAPLRELIFTLKVGQTAPQPIAIDFAYVLLRRCASGPVTSR